MRRPNPGSGFPRPGVIPLLTAALILLTAPAAAYDRYSQNRDATNCRACHGDFRAAPYDELAAGGGSWPDGLHNTHRNTMLDGDCDTCHSSGSRFPVLIDSSIGGDGLDAISCVGCHGRSEDASSGTVGAGAGLRQHHFLAGENVCLGCHADSDPANKTTAGEDVLPPYYANPGNNHPNMPTDSCNPSPGAPEDFAGTPGGLDNDGDGDYDEADTDCAPAVCGNGIPEAGEECDDGNTADGDCCSAVCTFEAAGSPCEDGVACTEPDSCDGAGTCDPGAPNSAVCDDGLFCNGAEFCDPLLDCRAGPPVDCDDGVGCTVDTCDEVGDLCAHTPDDASCDDGQFCNGAETCDAALDCRAGTPVDCDDGVGCTVDSCDETDDLCTNTPDDAACDDGEFCNGAETCDAALDCRAGTPVDCDDGEICTDDSCNEAGDRCDNVFDPTNAPECEVAVCGNGFVEEGEECDDGNTADGDCCSAACAFEPPGSACDDGVGCTLVDVCDGAGLCAGTPDDAACDDGQFCNGAETCDTALDCRAGAPVDCDDGVGCTVDSCDEADDTCVNAADDSACDDALFCNGAESCDPVQGCQAGTPVECDDGVSCTVDGCDEDLNACVNAPDDVACDDGTFCNGAETCDTVLDCQAGPIVDCDDGDVCTDDSCNEAARACDNTFDPDNAPECRAQCPDLDADGFSSAGDACGAVDCDDGDPAVNPGAAEDCADHKDNDCDGSVDAGDAACGSSGAWTIRPGPLSDPAYAGSAACARCHEDHSSAWRDSLHARMLIAPGDAQATGFPLPEHDPGAGVEIRSWGDVLFVIGQKWKTRFVDRSGFLQGIQWNYLRGDWTAYNDGRLADYDCGACHTTGYDAGAAFLDDVSRPVPGIAGSWVEYGIGCEACHGPGAAHAAQPAADNINRITFDWYDPDEDGVPDPVDIRSSAVCGNCHYRTDRDGIQTDRKSREQFNDWLVSGHAASLNPRSLNTYCAKCHSPGNAEFLAEEHYFNYYDPKNATQVSCISCHDPHATSQSRWAALGFPPGGRQDPREHQATVARYRGTDGNPETSDYEVFDNTRTNDLCQDCHRLQPGFRRHRDARPPEVIVLQPPADPFIPGSPRVPFAVPHREHVEQDNADCVDCHMSYSRTSMNARDVRTHSFRPNEWSVDRSLILSPLPHFSDTCGQCHDRAQDCDWCHVGLSAREEEEEGKRRTKSRGNSGARQRHERM